MDNLLPKSPWAIHQSGRTIVREANGITIAAFYCDNATGNKTYNEQYAQTYRLAQLFVRGPALVDTLDKCVQLIDSLLPQMSKVVVDIGLLNEALMQARSLLSELKE